MSCVFEIGDTALTHARFDERIDDGIRHARRETRDLVARYAGATTDLDCVAALELEQAHEPRRHAPRYGA